MNILVPIDFSFNAKRALSYALGTFGKEHNYTILHSVHVAHAGATTFVSLNQELKKVANAEMEELMEELSKEYPNYEIDPLIEMGFLTGVVNKIGEAEGTDLVIAGTKGASNRAEEFLGSNAAQLVAECNFPLFIVPENSAVVKPEKILFATDFKNNNELGKLNKLHVIIDELESSLLMLHVSTDDEDDFDENLPELEIFSDMDYSLNYAFSDDIEGAILEYAAENKVDVIASIPHKKNFFKRLLEGSMTRRLTHHSKIPLLVIK